MKIVSRAALMAMPPGTLYSSYHPCVFGDLLIKAETISHLGENIDWFYQSVSAGDIQCSGSDEWADLLLRAQENGSSLPLDFDCQDRDGSFNPDELFAVLEPQDAQALILRLMRAFKDATSPAQEVPHA